jgi:hypothetical protein
MIFPYFEKPYKSQICSEFTLKPRKNLEKRVHTHFSQINVIILQVTGDRAFFFSFFSNFWVLYFVIFSKVTSKSEKLAYFFPSQQSGARSHHHNQL